MKAVADSTEGLTAGASVPPESVLEAFPYPVMVIGDQDGVDFVNSAAEQFFGAVDVGIGVFDIRSGHWLAGQVRTLPRHLLDEADEICQEGRLPAAQVDDFVAEWSVRRRDHALDDVVYVRPVAMHLAVLVQRHLDPVKDVVQDLVRHHVGPAAPAVDCEEPERGEVLAE